ncbi:sensor histidine kinase [Propioniciclava coleopterorum]|uniref:sensor histidine kinase n=1 Tax=Propioniciclava coleopterorum TaxID=2714937 RepID=UPI0014087AEA|nr:HAMP domain-containing sensor histidine kinase [Propioniciclava coleopterorum]
MTSPDFIPPGHTPPTRPLTGRVAPPGASLPPPPLAAAHPHRHDATRPEPDAPGPRPLAPGTLSRQLVLRVTALVAVVAILLSALTALAMRQILLGQLDGQLQATASRLINSGRGPVGRFPDAGGPGQAQGLLWYVQGQGGFVQVEDTHGVLTDAVMERLEGLEPSRQPADVRLPSLGDYRVITQQVGGGRVVITGLPMAQVTASIFAIVAATATLTLLAILIAFLAARSVVERSLRPLARLAGTATQVSALDLRSGEVAVPVRVDERDADPRSEVGRVGLAFNHMLDNVEGALAARQRSETKVRQFVADASHELRNPLAAIRGYAELTRRERAETPETTAHALGRIESESIRMSRLVDDLLLLARLDAGPAIASGPTVLNSLLADAVSDARAAGPDHLWSLAMPQDEVVARADRHRLHQVVANLLANARTHTPAGTRVEAGLTVAGPEAVITVRDDGPGVPPDIVDHVFERFTRAETSRVRRSGTQSTGLGLAIVSAVMEAHGGSVSVESRPGATCFTLRIPLAGR